MASGGASRDSDELSAKWAKGNGSFASWSENVDGIRGQVSARFPFEFLRPPIRATQVGISMNCFQAEPFRLEREDGIYYPVEKAIRKALSLV
jgi:hypothetical protein